MTSGTRNAVPRLHVLTDPAGGLDSLRIVDSALAGGAPCIQVRVKGRSDREHLEFAAEVVRRCRAARARCLVNDRLDIALATGADGVHLGADDLPVATVRALVGRTVVIGGTARDPATARQLVADGADYLGVGPVYATSSKTGLPDPLGVDTLREVAQAVEVPVVAIAGITPDRVAEVMAAGAHGVAVVGAVTGADDPESATRAIMTELAAALPGVSPS